MHTIKREMVSIQVTDAIRKLIKAVEEDDEVLTDETHSMLATMPCSSSSSTIRWPVLKAIVGDVNRPSSSSGQVHHLHELCKGASLSFPQPPPRPPRPKELDERNKMLEEKLDEKEYQSWVADVTQAERSAEELREQASLLPTFRLQIGFTLHLIVTMCTFYAIFYVASVYLGADKMHPVWRHLAGVAGFTFGMLLETLLLIIRTNRPQKDPAVGLIRSALKTLNVSSKEKKTK